MRRALAVPLAVVAAAAVAAGAVTGLDAAGVIDTGLLPAGAAPAPIRVDPLAGAPSPLPAGPVLPGTSTAAPAPSVAGLSAVLDPLLTSDALGGGVSATVVDVTSGQVVYDRDGATPRTPASVAKLATAAAALTALGPHARLATRAVLGTVPGEVVLVGGGDPTLTATAQSVGAYPRWAALPDLADQVVASLTAATSVPTASATATSVPTFSGSAVSVPTSLATASSVPTSPAAAPLAAPLRVVVDDSAFAGPPASANWPGSYVSSGVVAPVTALAVDEGRVRPGADARVADPAIDAGKRLAALLRSRGVSVQGAVRRAKAPAGAALLGEVRSPPLAVLIEHMLRTSDNDLAEHVARLAAAAQGRPASFAGASAAVTSAVSFPDLPHPGRLLDGSGLSRKSRVTSGALARLLSEAAASDAAGSTLRPLLTGLPVAGWSGTLTDRFGGGRASAAAAGVVRAKTGTLTGVSTLAGELVDADGRLLVFAVLADTVGDTLAARAELDRVATALTRCGCR